MRNRGFITLAIGAKYYPLAHNLLRSYRLNSGGKYPFCIVTDNDNTLTSGFDDVVILERPLYSYLDKINLLAEPIYDENIFVDADTLIYGDIDHWFSFFPFRGVKCFGRTLPINNNGGWFDADGISGIYNEVPYSIYSHGGFYFFSKDELTHDIYITSLFILNHYDQFSFRSFEKPADEPIIALAMAVNDSPPIHIRGVNQTPLFCFLCEKMKIISNIKKGYLCYMTRAGGTLFNNVICLHFKTDNTSRALYKKEVARMNYSSQTILFLSVLYKLYDAFADFIYFVKSSVYRVLKRFNLI